MKLAEGEVVLTSTGRTTTPFPRIDTTSNLRAVNTLKRVDTWLHENAVAEAEARGDQFNLRSFKAEMPPATKDSMELYLFHK